MSSVAVDNNRRGAFHSTLSLSVAGCVRLAVGRSAKCNWTEIAVVRCRAWSVHLPHLLLHSLPFHTLAIPSHTAPALIAPTTNGLNF